MTRFVRYLTLSIGVALATTFGWRLLSRRYSLPCPSWLAWLLENPYVDTVAHADHTIAHMALEQGMSVLDVGCGPGRLTIPLAMCVGDEGHVVGLDIQPAMLSKARQKVERAGLTNLYLFFGLGMHRRTRYIQNFEEVEYGGEDLFIAPLSVVDGLAVYAMGSGKPLLLFPYPHGHTVEPMIQGPLAKILAQMDRTVISFDVPGAYCSSRVPTGNVDELIQSADEALARLGIQGPVDVVGHSMGGLAALAYATERPERIDRLVLVTSLSGFSAVARWGFPGSAFRIYDPNWWRIVVWGIRLNAGKGDLALHKRLQNLMESASYHDKSLFTPVEIDADDSEKGVPIRTIWSENMYSRLSYAHRLGDVQAPTLILAGRYDPEAPLPCSEELVRGIPDARLFIFEESGHFPFVEEAPLFAETVDMFLNEAD